MNKNLLLGVFVSLFVLSCKNSSVALSSAEKTLDKTAVSSQENPTPADLDNKTSNESKSAQTGRTAIPTECQHDSSTFRCVKYLKNYDGDTITISIPDVHPLIGKNISVRILGLDTPEIKTQDKCEKAAGRMAKNLVENLLKNAKNIEIRNIQRDKYFRILGDVNFDGKDLREILLKNKLAYEYFGSTKKKINWCEVDRQSL